jgi:CO/xanthine dehydrogenase FAD-binding subunit
VLASAAEAAAAQSDPVEDANGSVEYKRQLVRVLTKRCVRNAVQRAT